MHPPRILPPIIYNMHPPPNITPYTVFTLVSIKEEPKWVRVPLANQHRKGTDWFSARRRVARSPFPQKMRSCETYGLLCFVADTPPLCGLDTVIFQLLPVRASRVETSGFRCYDWMSLPCKYSSGYTSLDTSSVFHHRRNTRFNACTLHIELRGVYGISISV